MPTRATKNSLSLLADGVNTLLRIGAPVLDTPLMRLPNPRLLLLLSMLTHSPSSLTVRLLVQAYSTPAPSTHPTRSGGRWRTAYGTTYIPARPDRWSRGGNWPCDRWDRPGGSFYAAEYSWCGRSGKRRSKFGKARRRCHREYAVLSPAGASGLSPLLPATRQALLQARTPPVLLLKRWSAEVSEWASSSVRDPITFRVWADLRTIAEWHYDLVRGCLCSSSPVGPPTPSGTSPLS